MHRGNDAVNSVTATNQRGPVYRSCPSCGKVMNRRNYGRVSGVVLDMCKTCGVWFDADELAAIVRWVEDGGLDSSRARRAEADAADMHKPRPSMAPTTGSGGAWAVALVARGRLAESVAEEVLGGALDALTSFLFR